MLSIKDHHVWSADELKALLQNAPDIKTSFAAWVTPSDVLSEILGRLRRPNLSRIIPLALARDLRNERDVRLRDAGQETEKAIYLDSVFLDLPVAVSSEIRVIKSDEEVIKKEESTPEDVFDPGLDYEDEDGEEEDNIFGVVQALLIRSADKLDPDSSRAPKRGPRRNRIVILGGPGQGKSTIGQFLCQIARARILQAAKSLSLSPQTEEIIEPVLARAHAEGLPMDGPNRFPIRIDLPMFADHLALTNEEHGNSSLFAYMASRLSRELDRSISVDDLRSWLAQCPWLIVLDGLDEVPPSGNRKAIIQAIESLWDEIHLATADVLVVVTSRPQGYNESLSKRHWEHWEMTPLPEKDAVRFARRLAEIRLSDAERQKLVISEISRAAADPATALLATSPLQVTILFGIALLRGSIPQDRWDLFERYYSLLRDREAQKSGSDAALFREFKRQIDAVHHEAGFVLQVAAETTGGAAAYLTPGGFENIIRQHLEADGFDETIVERVVTDLRRVATDRLVLLSQRTEGRISFDVRSLQEFMAAARISSVGSVALQERLRAISTSAHWRHVYRIASSRIFSVADLAFLRNDVVGICHSLDSGDLGEDEQTIRAGASLALDLLLDGIADSTPKFKRNLLRRGFALLDLSSGLPDERFLRLLSQETEEVYKAEITQRLQQKGTSSWRAAFKLLTFLLSPKAKWVEKILIENFPDDAEQALQMFERSDPWDWSPAIKECVFSAQLKAGPRRVRLMQNRITMRARARFAGSQPQSEILRAATLLPTGYRMNEVNRISMSLLSPELRPLVTGRINALQTENLQIPPEIKQSEGWKIISLTSDFTNEPSKKKLAEIIMAFGADNNWRQYLNWNFSWPILSVLYDIEDGAKPIQLADEAIAGSFGDCDMWKAAEHRWSKDGITEQDLNSWSSGRFLNSNLAICGAPYFSIYARRSERLINTEIVDRLMKISQSIQNRAKRHRQMSIALQTVRASFSDLAKSKWLNYILTEVNENIDVASIGDLLQRTATSMPSVWQNEEFVDTVFRLVKSGHLRSFNMKSVVQIDLEERWREFLPIFESSFINLHGEGHDQIDDKLLQPRAADSSQLTNSLLLIRFYRGLVNPSEIDAVCALLLERNMDDYIVTQVLLRYSLDIRKEFIRKIHTKRAQLGLGGTEEYLNFLRREVESKPTIFTDTKKLPWYDLPSPQGRTASASG